MLPYTAGRKMMNPNDPEYGEPSPRPPPPTQRHGLLEQIRQNQLTQQMGSMNLMNPGINSWLSSNGSYSLMNVNFSPAPPPVMLQRPPLHMQASRIQSTPQQPMISGIGPRQSSFIPQQQQMGKSPQHHQNASGL